MYGSDSLNLSVADQPSICVRLAASEEALVLRVDGGDVGLKLGPVEKGPFGRPARGVADRPGRSSDLDSRKAREGGSQVRCGAESEALRRTHESDRLVAADVKVKEAEHGQEIAGMKRGRRRIDT